MTDTLSFGIVSIGDVVANQDGVAAAVEAHVGTIMRELAILQGGGYGQEAFKTRRGTWTLEYEASALQYLQLKRKSGDETYIVSAEQPPGLKALGTAMQDYPAFVEAYNEHVGSLNDVLDDVPTALPAIMATGEIVTQRDQLVSTARKVADTMAGELNHFDGEYGISTQWVGDARWELKWDDPRASYLRIGSEGGIYLLPQYEPPAASDVRELTGDLVAFVEAYNEYVDDLEVDLATVSFDNTGQRGTATLLESPPARDVMSNDSETADGGSELAVPGDDLAQETTSTRIDYSCPGFDTRADDVRLPDETESGFHYVDKPAAVVILPFTPDGDVVVIDEWRQTVGQTNRGLPVGSTEPDDDDGYATATRRKLAEEADHEAKAVEPLVTVEPANDIANSIHRYLVAYGYEPSADRNLDFNENIRPMTVGYDDLERTVLTGEAHGARAVLGVLYYELIGE